MEKSFLIVCSLLMQNIAFTQSYTYDNNHQIIGIKFDNGTTITYQYDANGNRIQKSFSSSTICPGSAASFYTNINGTTYQWQVDTGNGFINVSNSSVYSGATTNNLILTNPSTSWYGYKFRCVVNGGTYSNEEVLKFVSTWFGSKDTAWENPANWGCNRLPDENTDIIINGNALYFPVVNSNVIVRTLTANDRSIIRISSGYQFNVTH